jgi:hypothetical protein
VLTAFHNSLGKIENSSWKKYPERYKFISYNFYVNDFVEVIQRENYSFLELTGDIGGVIEFIRICLLGIVGAFAPFKINSLLANTLYTWIAPKGDEAPPG